MKRLLFLAIIFPSVLFADRLGSLKSNAEVMLSTQVVAGGGGIGYSVAPTTTTFTVGGDYYTGFTNDGTNFCLYVNGIEKECWTQILIEVINFARLEDNSFISLEDNSKLLLEH